MSKLRKATFVLSALFIFLPLSFASAQYMQSTPYTMTASSAHVRLTLHTGEVVAGEQIAEYDQSIWWWWRTSKKTRAIFNAARFSDDYRKDKSLRFIDSDRVAKVEYLTTPLPGPSYRQFLREKGIYLKSAPMDGRYWVQNGNERWHVEEGGLGDFAWDLVRTDSNGRRYANSGSKLTDYYAWNNRVYTPVSGTIVEILRSYPDLPIGVFDKSAKDNYLGIHMRGGYHFYLVHMKQYSIPSTFRVGQRLSAGAYIGRVGNAGVTDEPHLHVTMYFWDLEAPKPRYWSIPIEFKNTSSSSTPTGTLKCAPYRVPRTGEWLSGPASNCL